MRARLAIGATLAVALALVMFAVLRSRRPPSCRAGAAGADRSCGAGRNEDCCATRVIAGGTFLRTHDAHACPAKGPAATVSQFALDRFEVTVGRFRAFLDAGRGTRAAPPPSGAGAHPHIAESGWRSEWNERLAADRTTLETGLACGAASWTSTSADRERMPVNCVTWYEAFAFCSWDAARLPTEAEWNYAASGGGEQRVFPWSQPPSAILAERHHAVFARSFVEPVGSYSPAGDGRFGHADLAGNVWEWALDTADPSQLLPTPGRGPCELAGYSEPCRDCANLAALPAHILRGGGFGIPKEGLYSALRRGGDPMERAHVFGVRCARDVGGEVTKTAAPPSAVAPSVGDTFLDAPVRAHLASETRTDSLTDLTLAKLPPAGPYALLVFARTSTDVTQLRRIARVCPVAVVLIEGKNEGQAADAYDLLQWIKASQIAFNVAFDAQGVARARVSGRVRAMIIKQGSSPSVVAEDSGGLDRPALVDQFLALCGGKLDP